MSIDFGTDIYEEPHRSQDLPAGGQRRRCPCGPSTLREYIGQEKAKENLSIFIEAAQPREEASGPCAAPRPARAWARPPWPASSPHEMGVNIRITSGPAIEKPGDLAALLTNLNEGDILFVDEIHRLNRSVEEILYPAMEDYALDIIIGKGPSANSIRLDLPKFTLIGATTRAGQLSAPLRDRFGVTLRLELYTPEELAQIVTRSAPVSWTWPSSRRGPMEIARRSRGTPRIANRMLRRVRDFAQVKADGVITKDVADQALVRPGDRLSGPGPHGPPDAAGHHRELRRRPRGTGDPGRHHRRGVRDAGGRVRAVSDAAGLSDPDAPGPLRHPEGLRSTCTCRYLAVRLRTHGTADL